MHDDQGDDHDPGDRVRQRGEAHEIDGEAELGTPHEQAGDHQHEHAQGEQPEQHFLSAIVLALFRHVVVVAVDHLANAGQPLPVGVGHHVQRTEAEEHDDEGGSHQHPDEGVEDARPGSAAEQLGERIERRVEEGQAGECEKDEADAHEPVIGPLRSGVALQVFRIADHCASSLSTSFSISFETSLGPFMT